MVARAVGAERVLMLMGILLMAAVILAVMMPVRELPPLDQVQLRSHAIEAHGEDAFWARKGVFDCGVENLRAKYCPRSAKYGRSVHFWCQPPGATICPGMITSTGGVEKTSFVRPCSEWGVCR